MAVTQDKAAPYATTTSIIEILDRYRNRGLQTPFTKDVLLRAGVSESLVPRTLQALIALDLIDESGNPTDTLEGIRIAKEPEYKGRLEQWIRGAYADVFAFVDPSSDDETAVRDAFRSYRPVGQQDRMVALFLGLCVAAGLRNENQREAKPHTRSTTVNPTQQKRARPKQQAKNAHGQIPPALVGLLDSLPPEGNGWTQDQRDKFYATFGTVLDFCFPITKHDPQSEVSE